MLEHLVVDSGAIIKGCGFDFHKTAKRFWTVQDVINEIRDKKSLHLLETLPFELEIRVPSDVALRAVADFSRKTGDFAALSLTDMRVLALTYQLEIEQHGTQYLRSEPAKSLKMAAARAAAAASALSKVAAPSSSSNAVSSTGADGSPVTSAALVASAEKINTEDGKPSADSEAANAGEESDDSDGEDFDEEIEGLELIPTEGEGEGEEGDTDGDDDGESEEDDDQHAEEEVAPKGVTFAAAPSTVAWGGKDGGKEGGKEDTEGSVAMKSLQLGDEGEFPSLGAVKTKGGNRTASGLSAADEQLQLQMQVQAQVQAQETDKTSLWADLGDWVDKEGGVEGTLNTDITSSASAPTVNASSSSGTVKPWSAVASASVLAAEQIALAQGHTVDNAAYNSTHSWGRVHSKPSMYKGRNDAPLPGRKTETVEVEQSPDAATATATTATAATSAATSASTATGGAPSATVSFPPPPPTASMPSRILSSGGVGQQSAQAAQRLADEDDGQGWINPANIGKYRAGAHMGGGVSGSGSGSVGGGSGGNGAGGGGVGGVGGRVQSYSTMMMGGNAVTTAVPLDGFQQVMSKGKSAKPAAARTNKTNSGSGSGGGGGGSGGVGISKGFVSKGKSGAANGAGAGSSEAHFAGSGSASALASAAGAGAGTTGNGSGSGTGASASAMTRGEGQSANVGGLPQRTSITTACVTTDFSMQNVMMQMGLSVVSVDGMLIRAAKQWVLRCMACFKVHYELDRLFCSKCGAAHMSRVGASVNARTGELRLHLKANYRVSKLGTKYSIPKPGNRGRYEGELLLREDQLLTGIWRQKSVKIRKDVTSHFGADVTTDVGLHLNKGQTIVVGMGKRNPNAMKGRERRGKTKKTNK